MLKDSFHTKSNKCMYMSIILVIMLICVFISGCQFKSNLVTGADLANYRDLFQDYTLSIINNHIEVNFDQVAIPLDLQKIFTTNALKNYFEICKKISVDTYNKQIETQYWNMEASYYDNELHLTVTIYNVSRYFPIDYLLFSIDGFDAPIKLETIKLEKWGLDTLDHGDFIGSLPMTKDRVSQLGNYGIRGIYYLNPHLQYSRWNWDAYIIDYSHGFR